jgi:hypothetical protein
VSCCFGEINKKETKSCGFLWDGLTYNFFEVAPLVCKQWKNVVLVLDKLWQAFPWDIFSWACSYKTH